MRKNEKLTKRDLARIWHPCTQMKDHEEFPPIEIKTAKGSRIHTMDGRKLIDGVSSWWCKSLGHRHPDIIRAVRRQMNRFEHVIPAGTVQKPLVKLSEKLTSFIPTLNKVFYADSGSNAVEIAVKMAIQYHSQNGNKNKNLLASFENAYHGETALALSLGDCAFYSKPYTSILHKITKLAPLPYLDGKSSPIWEKMPDKNWEQIHGQLGAIAPRLAAIIFEPIVQGAGGMKIYSKDLLLRLRKWADNNNVLLIADEIMTGFHRTGPVFASMHAKIIPDFICLSKGLTAGWGAMSAVMTSQKIYDAFYDDYKSKKAFLHSSTYSGNALCATAAVEALNIYRREAIEEKVEKEACEIRKAMETVAKKSGALRNLRGIGYLVAADIVNPKTGKAFPPKKRSGFLFYQTALKNGAFLRNLGDTIYFMPPLNSDIKTISRLAKIATKTLDETLSKL